MKLLSVLSVLQLSSRVLSSNRFCDTRTSSGKILLSGISYADKSIVIFQSKWISFTGYHQLTINGPETHMNLDEIGRRLSRFGRAGLKPGKQISVFYEIHDVVHVGIEYDNIPQAIYAFNYRDGDVYQSYFYKDAFVAILPSYDPDWRMWLMRRAGLSVYVNDSRLALAESGNSDEYINKHGYVAIQCSRHNDQVCFLPLSQYDRNKHRLVEITRSQYVYGFIVPSYMLVFDSQSQKVTLIHFYSNLFFEALHWLSIDFDYFFGCDGTPGPWPTIPPTIPPKTRSTQVATNRPTKVQTTLPTKVPTALPPTRPRTDHLPWLPPMETNDPAVTVPSQSPQPDGWQRIKVIIIALIVFLSSLCCLCFFVASNRKKRRKKARSRGMISYSERARQSPLNQARPRGMISYSERARQSPLNQVGTRGTQWTRRSMSTPLQWNVNKLPVTKKTVRKERSLVGSLQTAISPKIGTSFTRRE